MKEIKDQGDWRSRLNSKIAPIIANVLGKRTIFAIRYYSHRHRFPNLKNPKDLSERILSAMLKKDFLKMADFADKVKVRKYVEEKGLGSILLEQYGAWKDANQIPFDSLPEKFILKANNGSGGHIICTNKSILNIPEIIDKMNSTLEEEAYILKNTEPHYSAIKPMILAEELMGDGTYLPVDYKFFCVQGQVVLIFIVVDREFGSKYCTLNLDWKPLDFICEAKATSTIPPKPNNINEMVKVAEILSSDFDFVRVDLYDYNGKVRFGELTFTPEGGIMSYFKDRAIQEIGKKFRG